MIGDQDGDSIPGNLQTRLEAELDRLKSIYRRGHNYTVRALPGQIRHGDNGGLLSGEVQNGTILIYESREDIAIHTLHHEYIEALFIVPLMKDCYLVMQHLRKTILEKDEIIHKLLMGKKEETVNGLSVAMSGTEKNILK